MRKTLHPIIGSFRLQPNHFAQILLLVCVAIAAASCENPYAPNADNGGNGNEDDGKAKITLRVSSLEQTYSEASANESKSSVHRAKQQISDVCTGLVFALYSSDGKKVKEISQSSTDSGYGEAEMQVSPATYTLVVIAHNGTTKPTMTDAKKITFGGKVTDTFYYYGQIEIADGKSYDLQLKRAVAKFCLVVEDNTPTDVTQMKFYYTGGSSTFDASTGLGCVNSKQTEERTVASDAYSAASSYEIYTFPKSESGTIDLTITALDGSSNSLYTRTFKSVPVKANTVTRYSGKLFGESSEDARSTFNVTFSDEWTYNDYHFDSESSDIVAQ